MLQVLSVVAWMGFGATESGIRTYGWRVWASIISGFAWFIFLIGWLFFYASSFDIYQNIAIFLVSFFVTGVINIFIFIPWRRAARKETQS